MQSRAVQCIASGWNQPAMCAKYVVHCSSIVTTTKIWFASKISLGGDNFFGGHGDGELKVWWYIHRIERSLAGVVGELCIMHAVFGSDYFRHPVLKVPPPPCQNALFRFFNRAFCHTINASSEPKLVNHKMLIISHVPVLRDDLSGGDHQTETERTSDFALSLAIWLFSAFSAWFRLLWWFKIETTSHSAIKNSEWA